MSLTPNIWHDPAALAADFARAFREWDAPIPPDRPDRTGSLAELLEKGETR